MTELARKAAEILEVVRAKRPLVHNITNYVVMNFTANALLCLGASPVMAHAIEEVEEMVGLSGALVINIGTLSGSWVDSMFLAGKEAKRKKIPVVLDPVGAGATKLRTDVSKRIIQEVKPSVIRANPSEILALSGEAMETRGVDAAHQVSDAEMAAVSLAKSKKTVVAVTGEKDFITNGKEAVRISNGHALMGRVTGTGCASSAVVGAFCAVEEDTYLAAASALGVYGIAGQFGARTKPRPGSYQRFFLDGLDKVSRKYIRDMLQYEKVTIS